MRVVAHYSHLNGKEFLLVHRKHLWEEVVAVIEAVDAEACRTRRSEERTRKDRMLYSPKDINSMMKAGFNSRGWEQRRHQFWVTSDENIVRKIINLPEKQQKAVIQAANREPISSYNQTDFVKERVAIEVQMGKYAFVAHDLFVKHMAFFVSDEIDVGIEILPMKEMEQQMSSGVPYFKQVYLPKPPIQSPSINSRKCDAIRNKSEAGFFKAPWRIVGQRRSRSPRQK